MSREKLSKVVFLNLKEDFSFLAYQFVDNGRESVCICSFLYAGQMVFLWTCRKHYISCLNFIGPVDINIVYLEDCLVFSPKRQHPLLNICFSLFNHARQLYFVTKYFLIDVIGGFFSFVCFSCHFKHIGKAYKA